MSKEQFVRYYETQLEIESNKAAGKPWPWSKDEILNNAVFCRVNRMDDGVSRWLLENWLKPHASDPDLIFAILLARGSLNNAEALAAMGYPVPYPTEIGEKLIARYERNGESCFRQQAYKILYIAQAYGPVGEGQLARTFAEKVYPDWWEKREYLRIKSDDSCQALFERLKTLPGLDGGFVPAQCIADAKCVPPLCHAPDVKTFVTPGPGSRRGLNRVRGRSVKAPWDDAHWCRDIARLREEMAPDLERLGLGDLDLQGLQHGLCELDKRERYAVEGIPTSRLYWRAREAGVKGRPQRRKSKSDPASASASASRRASVSPQAEPLSVPMPMPTLAISSRAAKGMSEYFNRGA
jgi:5-hmdU DNA kinase, helical domain